MMNKEHTKPYSTVGLISLIWAIGGVLALLLFAIYRLSTVGFAAFEYELYYWHWFIFIGALIFMLFFEGYKGFQQAFAPRVVKRAWFLATTPQAPVRARVFAPLFAMAYFYATRRRQIASILLTIMIICFILLFRNIAQPLRGLLDLAVCAGLIWGVASILINLFKLSRGFIPDIASEIMINTNNNIENVK